MELWPHQPDAVDAVIVAMRGGTNRICLTSPTGGGKTTIVELIVKYLLSTGKRVVLYTNRKMMMEQLSDDFTRAGIRHGIRAAGYTGEDLDSPFQISSVPTETRRVVKDKKWLVHECDLAIFDEGHLHTNGLVLDLRKLHLDAGATTLDVTATPLGMAGVCDKLIVAGTNSSLRECGALVLAEHYGPDEPDMREFKKRNKKPPEGIDQETWDALAFEQGGGEDLTQGELKKAFRPTAQLFGRVHENFLKINPDARPSIGFGPGVEESIWFAEQFSRKGIRSAHIDGSDVYLDGKLYVNTPQLREDIINGSRDVSIKIVWNRYVFREGINAPWLVHGIFATIFGSLQSYLQSGGRLLRSYPGVDTVTIQDHGGNWWRHGSLNSDRIWSLRHTSQIVFRQRADRIRNGGEKEPFRCPGCGKIWVSARLCTCGYELAGRKRPRPVITTDGKITLLQGHPFRPRVEYASPDGPGTWKRMYFAARQPKWNATFRMAMAYFAQKHDWHWPQRNWPFMPVDDEDLDRRVADVDVKTLYFEGDAEQWLSQNFKNRPHPNAPSAEAAAGLFSGAEPPLLVD